MQDASLCLLASIMRNASARTFDRHCECAGDATRDAGPAGAPKAASHKTHGSSASTVVLTEADRALVAQLTWGDGFVYARARVRFFDDVSRFKLTCLLSPINRTNKR